MANPYNLLSDMAGFLSPSLCQFSLGGLSIERFPKRIYVLIVK